MSASNSSAFEATYHAADHPQEVLRKALWETRYRGRLSPQKIIILRQNAGHDLDMSDRALRMFIDNETKNCTEEKFKPLAAYLLELVIGRTLRTLDAATAPSFLELFAVLGSGQHAKPKDMRVAGRYYMYHGSYIEEARYVIRAIEIAEEDQIFTVTDTIRDTVRIVTRGEKHVARGALTFVHGLPQILLHGDENKCGLSLVLAAGISTAGATLHRVSGALLVLTVNNEVASRRCFLIREEDDPAKAMIEQSGIVSLAELPKLAKKHQDAFGMLAEDSFDPDPILLLRQAQPAGGSRGL